MSIKQLIEAIEQGDASTIAALFDKVMAGKLAEAIESKKQEVAEDLFLEQKTDLTEMYTVGGTLKHEGKSHKFAVKFADFPDRSDVEKQNAHLSKHHVDAVMNHIENHGDDDMTGTKSKHKGAEVHVTRNTGYQGESIEDFSIEEIEAFMQTEDYEQLDELSKNTLGNYIKGASNDRVRLQKREAELDDKSEKLTSAMHNIDDKKARDSIHDARVVVHNQRDKVDSKHYRRHDGIKSAVKRLTK